MRRAVRFVALLLTFWLSCAGAQENEAQPWTAIAIDQPSPGLTLVQEPYCEMGAGTCGGQCGEEGKQWACPPRAIPCYRPGHCTCEEASICKPKKKK